MNEREIFYRDEFKPKIKKCCQCNNELRPRDYLSADRSYSIATVRTCRYCKHILAKKRTLKLWEQWKGGGK